MAIERPTLSEAKQAFEQVYDDIGRTVSAVGRLTNRWEG